MMRNQWTDRKDSDVVSWGRVRVMVNDAQQNGQIGRTVL